MMTWPSYASTLRVKLSSLMNWNAGADSGGAGSSSGTAMLGTLVAVAVEMESLTLEWLRAAVRPDGLYAPERVRAEGRYCAGGVVRPLASVLLAVMLVALEPTAPGPLSLDALLLT